MIDVNFTITKRAKDRPGRTREDPTVLVRTLPAFIDTQLTIIACTYGAPSNTVVTAKYDQAAWGGKQ